MISITKKSPEAVRETFKRESQGVKEKGYRFCVRSGWSMAFVLIAASSENLATDDYFCLLFPSFVSFNFAKQKHSVSYLSPFFFSCQIFFSVHPEILSPSFKIVYPEFDYFPSLL